MEGEKIAILDLARVEFRAALRRREREGDISSSDADRILRQLDDQMARLFLIQPVNSRVIEAALSLLDRHSLRAYDAMQLAGCLAVRPAVPHAVTFVCSDQELVEAGQREGVAVFNPEAADAPSK